MTDPSETPAQPDRTPSEHTAPEPAASLSGLPEPASSLSGSCKPGSSEPAASLPGSSGSRPQRPIAVRILLAVGRGLLSVGKSILNVIFVFSSAGSVVNPAATDEAAERLRLQNQRANGEHPNRDYRP